MKKVTDNQKVYDQILNEDTGIYDENGALRIDLIQTIAAHQEEFEDYAESVADRYCSILGMTNRSTSHLKYSRDTITIYWNESYWGQQTETGSTDMPVSYLWEWGWEAKLTAKLKRAEAKQRHEDKIQERKTAEAERERELEQLAKLKLKYEE